MKKHSIFFIVTLLFTIPCYSQTVHQIKVAMDFYRNYKLVSGDWENMLSEEHIEGSPYLNKEFVNGNIFTTSNIEYIDIPLRYNIYNDQIEFKTPENNILALATPDIVEKVIFDNIQMVYMPYFNAKKIRHGFFKVLENGEASLYAKPDIHFQEATPPAAYKEAGPAKFLSKPDIYYIKVGSAQAKRINNKKELVSIFPKYNKEIETFIKKNKIKPGKPESLKKLVHYYNILE